MERLESQAQAGDKESKKHKTPPRWITESMWRQCQHLDATMPEFGNLCRSIISNYRQWKFFNSRENPYQDLQRPFDHSKVTLSTYSFFFDGTAVFFYLALRKLAMVQVSVYLPQKIKALLHSGYLLLKDSPKVGAFQKIRQYTKIYTVDSRYLDPSYLDPITYVELISKSRLFSLCIYCISASRMSNYFYVDTSAISSIIFSP